MEALSEFRFIISAEGCSPSCDLIIIHYYSSEEDRFVFVFPSKNGFGFIQTEDQPRPFCKTVLQEDECEWGGSSTPGVPEAEDHYIYNICFVFLQPDGVEGYFYPVGLYSNFFRFKSDASGSYLRFLRRPARFAEAIVHFIDLVVSVSAGGFFFVPDDMEPCRAI